MDYEAPISPFFYVERRLSLLQAIDMQNCDVYSYKGDGEMDPLSTPFLPSIDRRDGVQNDVTSRRMELLGHMQMGQDLSLGYCTIRQ